MLASAILIFAMNEVGFQLGRGKVPDVAGNGPGLPSPDPAGVVQGAAFTILALLLGFSFSLGLGRYDARRAALVHEATAIGTTFLRAKLLDAKTAATVRGKLRAYVAERLEFARADAKPQQRRRCPGEIDRYPARSLEHCDPSCAPGPTLHDRAALHRLAQRHDQFQRGRGRRARIANSRHRYHRNPAYCTHRFGDDGLRIWPTSPARNQLQGFICSGARPSVWAGSRSRSAAARPNPRQSDPAADSATPDGSQRIAIQSMIGTSAAIVP